MNRGTMILVLAIVAVLLVLGSGLLALLLPKPTAQVIPATATPMPAPTPIPNVVILTPTPPPTATAEPAPRPAATSRPTPTSIPNVVILTPTPPPTATLSPTTTPTKTPAATVTPTPKPAPEPTPIPTSTPVIIQTKTGLEIEVREEETDALILGASVEITLDGKLISLAKTEPPDGKVKVTAAPGLYDISVRKTGYQPDSFGLVVRQGNVTGMTVRLKRTAAGALVPTPVPTLAPQIPPTATPTPGPIPRLRITVRMRAELNGPELNGIVPSGHATFEIRPDGHVIFSVEVEDINLELGSLLPITVSARDVAAVKLDHPQALGGDFNLDSRQQGIPTEIINIASGTVVRVKSPSGQVILEGFFRII